MAESKKYFWLRLKRDFFKRHDIQIIEAMPNGKDYILFYLKLLCESVDHEGHLRFSEQIPYNEQMLSTITNTNVDVVKQAIKIFTELGMMDVLDDGTLFMHEVEKMLGFETEWAQKKRDYRNRIEDKARTKKDNVRQEIEKEIEIEKELEIEIEKKKERINYQKIVDIYNNTCVSFPRVSILSDSRKKAIKKMLDKYTIEDFKLMLKKAEASPFLKGAGDSNWSANFDWMIKDSNMVKILDGNYDERPKQNKVAEQLEQSYEMMSRWAEEDEDANN
jgi:predicted phage replisome organizer